MKKLGKILSGIVCVWSVVLMLWLGLSWVDIIADNCEPNPVHHPYNAFVVLVEMAENN